MNETSEIYAEQGNRYGKGKSDPLLMLVMGFIFLCLSIFVYIAFAENTKNPIFLIFDSYDEIICVLLPICVSLACFVISSLLYADYWSKVRICKEGVLIKYPFFFIREKLIPWCKFQDVCICSYKYHSRYYSEPEVTEVYVCMVKYGERTDAAGLWRVKNPFHFSRIIRVNYEPGLIQFLKDKCGIHVVQGW